MLRGFRRSCSGLLVFDFGDDLDVFAAVRFQVLTDFNDVRTFTDKGCCNEVNALLATEDQVLFVFSASAGSAMETPGRLTPLFSPVAVVQHFTDNFVTFDSGNFHADQTIVNQNGIADGQIFSEAFISHCNDFVVADNGFVGGEGEGLARFQGKRRYRLPV